MVEWRGDRDWRGVRGPFLCVSCVQGLNCGTQLSIPGHSPCPWHQATDCPNRDIPSTLPNIVSSSSAHRYTHPVLTPLHIALLLPQGQVVANHSWGCGTPFPSKGLGGQHETHHVSSIVLWKCQLIVYWR